MTTVNEILRYKGGELVTIDPDATVYDALALMRQRNIGALLVLEKGRLVGVLSERDYARNIILQGLRASPNSRCRRRTPTRRSSPMR